MRVAADIEIHAPPRLASNKSDGIFLKKSTDFSLAKSDGMVGAGPSFRATETGVELPRGGRGDLNFH